MSKSSRFNSPTILLPVLAVAVLGMAAMVGVTSNLQKTLDPSSQAAGNKCESVSHPLDHDFVGRHFKKIGEGTIKPSKDGDRLEIFQPDSTSSKETFAKFDRKGVNSFIAEVQIKEISVKNDGGNGFLIFKNPDDSVSFAAGIHKFKDGTSYAFAQHQVNNVVDISTKSVQKKMKYPITIRIERDGDKITYSYKETGGKFQNLRENDVVTSEVMNTYLATNNQATEYPEVTTSFTDLSIKCK